MRPANIPCLLFFSLLAACGGSGTGAATKGNNKPSSPRTGPFEGLSTRYDGYYKSEAADIVYLIRLFPEGNAVLINGVRQIEDELPGNLVRDAVPDPDRGHYNVMVDVRNDSLFFVTTPRRGEISYSGTITPEGDLSLLRRSHITGKQQVMVYRFIPD